MDSADTSGVGQQPALFEDETATTPRGGYRGPTVCKIVGITYRQLDYWARTDLVTPSVQQAKGSGTQRLYAFDDIVQLKVVKKLLDTGVSLQRVRAAVEDLRQHGSDINDQTLVSDGDTVYAVDDQQHVIDLLQRGQSVFAIALGPVITELEGDVRSFPLEAADDAGPVVEEGADAAPADGRTATVTPIGRASGH